MFQSKAGYIDARPLTANSSKNFLQRTAGPYIRVINDKTQGEHDRSAFGCIATKLAADCPARVQSASNMSVAAR
jgi:hypothetical protein